LNNLSSIYKIKGDLELALEYIESSIKLNNEMGNFLWAAGGYDFLIQILLEKGDINQAKKSLERFRQLKNQLKHEETNRIYLFNKALILKKSLRARERGKAEELLISLLEEWKDNHEYRPMILLNLCDLLLIELKMLNDMSILEEVESYLSQLLDLTEKSKSYYLLAETYYLKAKLALLTLNIKETKRFLIQAEKIAQKFNFNQLAIRISVEHEKLNNQIDIWEGLNNVEVSMEERIKLAGIDKQIYQLLQNRANLIIKVKEEKLTIYKEQKLCLVCRGEISGFMYSCTCNTIYCETCVRALIELENICWVCNAPIDMSKPIKHDMKDNEIRIDKE